MLAEHLPALEAALRAYDVVGRELLEAVHRHGVESRPTWEARYGAAWAVWFRDWQAREAAALAAFREAFYMATSDINSRDHAFLVHPDDGYGFARRMLFRAGFDPGLDADARALRGWGW